MTKPEPLPADLHGDTFDVVVEQLPFADLIRRYDGSEVLFYLDPIYWGCGTDYGEGILRRADIARLAVQLGLIAGHFVLSINATDGAREVFGRFVIEEVWTTSTICAGGERVKELIVRGPG